MGFFDWLRPKPRRSVTAVSRDLAHAVFALHRCALDRVLLHISADDVVLRMDVPELDPARSSAVEGESPQLTAKISGYVAELRRCGAPVAGAEVIVMRDRVAWMPSVIPFSPPVE